MLPEFSKLLYCRLFLSDSPSMIRKKMFVFEDILLLDDKAIQRVLRDVDNNDLAVALKGANEQVQNAIFNNLSKRLVVMIKEDMEFTAIAIIHGYAMTNVSRTDADTGSIALRIK